VSTPRGDPTARTTPVVVRPSLVIEASTYRASAAVVVGEVVMADTVVAMRGASEERLMPAVAEVLSASGVGVMDLDRVVCGAGPGSFTSLRIAAALAKGLTTAIPNGGPRLAAVSSLLLIVGGAVDRLAPASYVASLDALRGERYATLVTVADPGAADGLDVLGADPGAVDGSGRGLEVRASGPTLRRSEAAVAAWAADAGATIIGPGCAVDAWPEARGVTRVWTAVHDVDAARWEPDYGRAAEAAVRRAAAEARAGDARTGGRR
jgi:tRNA threonylcarbamoyladenosine biosynthesis protein TsaB